MSGSPCKHQEIANAIESVCQGHQSVDVMVAISMVIGAFAAQAERPNLAGLTLLIHKTAKETFDRIIEERAR